MFSKGFGNFIDEGGFGMFPTLAFGFVLAVYAVLYLLKPQPRAWPVLGGLFGLTLGSGVLGTTVGVITTLHVLPQVKPEEVFLVLGQGVAESANNLVLSFIFLMLSGLMCTIGLARASRTGA